MIPMTRLRPSSIGAPYHFRSVFAKGILAFMRLRWIAALVCLATVCHGQVALSGTLVVVVPSNDGVAVVSDTRRTVASSNCDGEPKVFAAKARKNTVVFETGEGIQVLVGPVHPTDICEYTNSAPRILDISDFVLRQVDAAPNKLLSEDEVRTIATRTLTEVREYAQKYSAKHPLQNYVGANMFRAVIVSYDDKRNVGLLGSFIGSVNLSGMPDLNGKVEWKEFSTTDKVDDYTEYFGETDYVVANVVRPENVHLLVPHLALTGKTISQVSLGEAVLSGRSLVSATEQIAKTVKPPNGHGIGGPIDVTTITKEGVKVERYSGSDATTESPIDPQRDSESPKLAERTAIGVIVVLLVVGVWKVQRVRSHS